MTDFKHIKNIIFDLGAVIIDIDFARTFQAFAKLSPLSADEIMKRYHDATFFTDFEKGMIGNHIFIEKVRDLLELSSAVSNEQIVESWNRLLIQIPENRIKRIQTLSETYRVFLLSNTNPMHIHAVNNILYTSNTVDRLERLFETAWFSYDLGLVKPHRSIYDNVLHEKSLKAEETVFLDDNADNIKGALEAGIIALHVQGKNDLIELLRYA